MGKLNWAPVEDAIDGFTCYRILTGRIFWYFFLSEAYPKGTKDFSLSREGILRLVEAPWTEETVIRRIAGVVAEKYNHSTKHG